MQPCTFARISSYTRVFESLPLYEIQCKSTQALSRTGIETSLLLFVAFPNLCTLKTDKKVLVPLSTNFSVSSSSRRPDLNDDANATSDTLRYLQSAIARIRRVSLVAQVQYYFITILSKVNQKRCVQKLSGSRSSD